MVKKSLFTKDERYTEEALKLSAKVESALAKILKVYIDLGYSAREIEYIFHDSAALVSLETRIPYTGT